MKIFLLRHGETDWNIEKRWQGSKDIELNQNGILQAENASKRLEKYKIDAIYTSPLLRAKKTAEVINENRNVPIYVKEDIKEISFGEWEGLTYHEVLSGYKKAFDTWDKDASCDVGYGVENYLSLQNRAFKVFQEICEESNGNILIVSHGAWIMALVCKILHIPLEHRLSFQVGNTSITTIEYEDSQFTMKTLNDVSHI